MKSKLNLLKEFATRIKVGDYEKIYSILPDQDKLLIENNYDYSIYRDLLTDPHLMATIQQRKMQVAQMSWQIEHEGDPKVKEKVIEIFRQLSLGEIISNILDSIFFGFSVGK
ncbi:MAG TPA: hypothetical protein VMT35_17670 [Ignavibacteriaceae bacterium]|nr:hypothetical protein [Ignavibacteriaceae bacterium]